MDIKTFALVLGGFTVAIVILVNVTLGAVVRLRALKQQPDADEIQARLSRIEDALDALTVQTERNSEFARLNARAAEHARIQPPAP